MQACLGTTVTIMILVLKTSGCASLVIELPIFQCDSITAGYSHTQDFVYPRGNTYSSGYCSLKPFKNACAGVPQARQTCSSSRILS